MKKENSLSIFFRLVQAGLWGNRVQLAQYDEIDFSDIFRIAEEQSVVGLVTAGLERLTNKKTLKKDLLQFIGRVTQLEQRNLAMNHFIEKIVNNMRSANIYTIIVKGQGVAQTYEKPLWRTCGDVDFLLSFDNYQKAKAYLLPLASSVDKEKGAHYGMIIDSWVVELHGNLNCGLSNKMDREIQRVQDDVFYGGNVRSWFNGETQCFLPGVDNDIIFVFTHIIKHFYKGGIGLRQICDWCRLLWTYRAEVNLDKLEESIREMGLMTEWKAFAAFAVEYLGMPEDAMPFYMHSNKWSRKAKCICSFVMGVGNFGQNRKTLHSEKYPYILNKAFSFSRRLGDLMNHARIFPFDSMVFFPKILFNGLRSALKGY